MVLNNNWCANRGKIRVIMIMMQAQETRLERHIHIVTNVHPGPAIQIYIAIDYTIIPNDDLAATMVTSKKNPHA
ncbi:hypothetical protein EMIT0P176_90137 [Pseudomonas sp. IT-P176]